ncbi:MAG: DUF499 domain-containing protein [Armatimonadetes bacterium]|nr:DUF499 domain-containing protein [Armatimonadota bacterium]MDW8122496.1 DUF499 domain-containing protein [Armatimonadota bacterium]
MATKGTKRVWEVCEPHPDVFARDPDPSVFAISLHHVEQGVADKDYTDPETFFQKTFMTKSLERLLEGVLARLAGAEGRGTPILRLETPFGGGKTHTMTALFHLARHPEVVQEQEAVRRILTTLNRQFIPSDIRVAVLDGRGLDVGERRTEDGVVIRTLWGELAYRLGGKDGYELLKDADKDRQAPGSDRLTKLLQPYQPFVILVDEFLEYLIKARAVKVGESSLMEQTCTFLGALTASVSACPKTVLVVALPASSLEVSAEDSETAELLFQRTRKLLGRWELVETPVTQDEVFGVLRRRLFHHTGTERERKKTVEAFQEYYAQYSRFFPERFLSPEYRQRMLDAYPFHPALIDLMYERWGPHPQFQRTRGALRLLALVLRRVWNQRLASAFLIQPHHIDLSDRHIRGEVLRLLDSGFDAIIAGDVLQKADEIERGLGGDYARERLGKGAASCAFYYSVTTGTREIGATEEEIRTALLRPDINPAMVSEVLGRLRDGLWYLRYRDHRYYFTARPNLNKLILDYEQEIAHDSERLANEFNQRLEEISGKGGTFQIIIARSEPSDVPDRERPTLVVLSPEVKDEQEWMNKAVQYAGESIRRNKNMLVFLAPRKEHMPEVQSILKRWLAIQTLMKSSSFQELETDDKDQVRGQERDKEKQLKTLLLKTYSLLYRPSGEGVQEVPAQSVPEAIKAKSLTEFADAVLRGHGILIDKIAPEFLKEILKIDKCGPVGVRQVTELLTDVPGYPLLADPPEAVRQAIQEGVQKSLFALETDDNFYSHQTVPTSELQRPDAKIVSTTAPPPPPPPPPPQALTLRVRTDTQMLYPILRGAQQLLKVTAQVLLEVSDETGELGKIRDELDKLFKDYGCTVEWQ